jgi:hypothetical protein
MATAVNLPTNLRFPTYISLLLEQARSCQLVNTVEELYQLSCPETGVFEAAFDVPDRGRVVEATVCRVRNGISVNFPEPYMRRRDPDCMVIADELPTDKPRFSERYGSEFADMRQRTFDWLREQDLIVFFIHPGGEITGLLAVVIIPAPAAFFGFTLSLLQGIVDSSTIPDDALIRGAIYVAPPFRHTDFEGKQVVVHSRGDVYEMFSYNLYPGPSAKKGVYGMLIDLGEQESWVTMHCSAVQVVTPYDNMVGIAHEGASGGGKSELLEYVHREPDGQLKLGKNTVTGEERFLSLPVGCRLKPVVDDMAICHPSFQKNQGKFYLMDAEEAWFVRVDHIQKYGTDPHIESETINTPVPILFLNLNAAPGSTALIWEHTEDAPGKRCPNPRVILPRRIVPDVVNSPIPIDIRSFGVRTPPCTKENPSYGIFGIFHILPPALAWLWRLVAPRGYANPSITDTEGLQTEGVGSYWPFAPGRRVPQANLLLDQFTSAPKVRYVLCPNQHVGCWKVGFMPEWTMREYLARRGVAKFQRNSVEPARCSLLGYTLKSVVIEGQTINNIFLQVEKQPEVGLVGYDLGADILTNFFKTTLLPFLEDDLLPLGRQIIDCALNNGTLADYEAFIQSDPIFEE